ncbi:fimbrial protein [Providencia rustigianii]|uniref:fimbrial protein n=1 Tax=Providencia rustigianii TaxID=158850 RepID=UPI000D9D6C58|nr:fimbrial protein [Providencia rustigianii]SPY76168.1 Type-1A pilin [Providencia rustigianii]
MKKLIIKSVLVVGCLYLGHASAGCIQNQGFSNIQVNVPSRTYNIQYDDLGQRDLETISIRYLNGSNTYANENGECGTSYLKGNYINSWAPNSAKIAPSNISGIGLVVTTAAIGNFNVTYGPNATDALYWKIYETVWHITIKKTGQVTSTGSIRSGAIAQLTQTNTTPSGTWYLTTLNMPANTIKINVISCSLKNNQNTYNINMGDWYDTQFKNINDTQGMVNIPIALSCLSGTNIKVTVTSDTIDNAANGRLGLVGADKATGIAIQLLNNTGTPIILNQKFTQQDGVTQTDYIFGWKARYIKTAATITPGTANANATVNIRYE